MTHEWVCLSLSKKVMCCLPLDVIGEGLLKGARMTTKIFGISLILDEVPFHTYASMMDAIETIEKNK